MSRKFCSIPSRLFSGDPTALLTPLAVMFTQGAIADLTTPYTFQFDTNQVPDSVFWHMTKIVVTFYNGSNNLSANLNLLKLMMMPNNLVGSASQDSSGTINTQNVGIELNQENSDLINNSVNPAGYQTIFFPDCDLPQDGFCV